MEVTHSTSRYATYRFAWLSSLVFAVIMMTALSGVAWAEKVNLNTADAEALEYIPGIGPSKAQQIITERAAINGFKNADDLLAVPGIGQKTLDVIMLHGALDSGVSTLTEEMRNNPPAMSRNRAGDAESASTSG